VTLHYLTSLPMVTIDYYITIPTQVPYCSYYWSYSQVLGTTHLLLFGRGWKKMRVWLVKSLHLCYAELWSDLGGCILAEIISGNFKSIL